MIATAQTEQIKRDEIKGVAGCLDKNMFVEAGAGAGKTTLVVERILNQLKTGDKPGEFVVITFTNAAAEELRNRIFEKVKNESPNNALLQDALKHLDEMQISTIHSFCNVILKEQSILAGLPQDIELMEEEEKVQYQRALFNEFMASKDSELWSELEKYSKQGITDISQYIFNVYSALLGMPDNINVIKITQKNVNDYQAIVNNAYDIVQKFRKELLEQCNKLIDQANEKKKAKANNKEPKNTINKLKKDTFLNSDDPASKYFTAAFTKKVQALFNVQESVDQNKIVAMEILKWGNDKADFLKKVEGEDATAANESLKSCFINETDPTKDLSKLYELVSQDKMQDLKSVDDIIPFYQNNVLFFNKIVDLGIEAKKYYLDHKDKKKLSNDDLLNYTNELICFSNNNAILDFYSKKYKHLYVDEFQDTDSVQASFLYRLATDPADATHQKLRDGVLFVVGDPKQSIYRFRGAEPEVYYEVKACMSDPNLTNAYVYELENNYRSNSDLLDWINASFQNIELTNSNYKPMASVRHIYQNGGVDPRLIYGAYKYEKPDKDQELEPKEVGKLIQNIMKTNLITEYDNQGIAIGKREIKYKDFLILTATTTKMEPYMDEFRKLGIPVRFDGKELVSSFNILNMFVRIYWYLINSKDNMRRVGAIEAIRNGYSFNGKEEEAEERAEAYLKIVKDEAKGMSAFGKARYLQNNIGIMLKKDNTYSTNDLTINIRLLQQMVETVMNSVSGTGVQLAEAFEKYLATNLEHELALEPDVDAVRFMNLHKAKGLQGNIVIITDRRAGARSSLEDLRQGNDYYPALVKKSEYQGNSMATVFKSLAKEDLTLLYKWSEDEKAEAFRLEYVAATRAGEALIFVDSSKGLFAGECYRDAMGKLKSLVIDDNVASQVTVSNQGIVRQKYDQTKDNAPVVIKKEALYSIINPSKCENASGAQSIKKAVKTSLGEEKVDELRREFMRPSGNVLGDILHRTMELLINRRRTAFLDDASLCKTAKICSQIAISEHIEDVPHVDNPDDYADFSAKAAVAYGKWIKTQDFVGVDKDEFYTEMPFSFFDSEKKEWNNGTADLIIKHADGKVTLIDYKSDDDYAYSDADMAKVFKTKYMPQVEIYKDVIKKSFGTAEDDIKMGIISFSLKDSDGKKLPDGELRVRWTEM